MLNQSVLVGRLANDIEIQENEDKEKVATITLAIPRGIKNSDGLYDTDFIDCTLVGEVAINTKKYCSVGNIIGAKAHIKARTKLEDKVPMQLVADKITFLSSKREDTK